MYCTECGRDIGTNSSCPYCGGPQKKDNPLITLGDFVLDAPGTGGFMPIVNLDGSPIDQDEITVDTPNTGGFKPFVTVNVSAAREAEGLDPLGVSGFKSVKSVESTSDSDKTQRMDPLGKGRFTPMGCTSGFSALGEADRLDPYGDGGYHGQKSEPFSALGDLDNPGREIPPVPPKQNTLFCTGCGKPTPADSVFCEHCGKQLLTISAQKKFQWKKWMTVAACCVVLLIGIILVSAGHNGAPAPGGYPDGEVVYTAPLSDSCDFVLCQGTDTSGNSYELVANQTESSLGYEITVGVIKNNDWLYPMSSDFPFLGEDGLFHVSVSMAGDSGTSLAQVNEVIQKIYFVDSGAFLMDSYKETDSWVSTYDHYNIIFSCSSLKSYTVNCKESTLLYQYSEATFTNGQVKSYGRIDTENGKIVLYTETSGTSSGWLEDQVFDWSTLNAETLSLDTIASGVAGVRPESILSEGLIFASDQCFYNTSGQKVIDLSEYNIDMWYNGNIYFDDGTCTFTAENSLGTEFLITIDKSGNVLSEVEK